MYNSLKPGFLLFITAHAQLKSQSKETVNESFPGREMVTKNLLLFSQLLSSSVYLIPYPIVAKHLGLGDWPWIRI